MSKAARVKQMARLIKKIDNGICFAEMHGIDVRRRSGGKHMHCSDCWKLTAEYIKQSSIQYCPMQAYILEGGELTPLGRRELCSMLSL